jgi:hypothetical protein
MGKVKRVLIYRIGSLGAVPNAGPKVNLCGSCSPRVGEAVGLGQ